MQEHSLNGTVQLSSRVRGVMLAHELLYLFRNPDFVCILTTIESCKFKVLWTGGFISNYQLFK